MTDITDRIKEALKGVTDGPWAVDVQGTGTGSKYFEVVSDHFDVASVFMSEQDAHFIVAARTLLPEALKEIEELREKLAEYGDDCIDGPPLSVEEIEDFYLRENAILNDLTFREIKD